MTYVSSFSSKLCLAILILLVSACNSGGGGGGGTSNETPSSNTLATPTGLTATPNNATQITITWQKMDGATSYKLYRSENDTKPDAFDTSYDASTLTTTNDNLQAGTTYYYWLEACNASECSAPATIQTITYPDTPTNPKATADSATQITITWNSVKGAARYNIYRSANTTKDSKTLAEPLASAGNSYTDKEGLRAATTYYYWLEACNASGCSAPTRIHTKTYPLNTPNITATADSATQITITWQKMDDATSYKLYRSEDDIKPSETLAQASESETSYTDTKELQAGTTYYYWLEACNTNGCSAPSDVAQTTTSLGSLTLNDTGLTRGANKENNEGWENNCSSHNTSPQDCDQGRDATHNNNSNGHAGFEFTKIRSTGAKVNVISTTWSCVQDEVTGLMWEVKTTSGLHDKNTTYTWEQAKNFATNVNGQGGLCGYTDWRVPYREELLSIVNFNRYRPSIDTTYFNNAMYSQGNDNALYWSASLSERLVDTDYAWGVNFKSGESENENRTKKEYVRLVRGKGPSTNYWGSERYINNQNGTITDRVTGLMWKRCSEGQSGNNCDNGTPQKLTWTQSLRKAHDSTFANHNDWRVPNIKELSSLARFVETDISVIDTVFFPNDFSNRNEGYWSSTSSALGGAFSTWSMRSRVIGYNPRSGSYEKSYLRLVRGGN